MTTKPAGHSPVFRLRVAKVHLDHPDGPLPGGKLGLILQGPLLGGRLVEIRRALGKNDHDAALDVEAVIVVPGRLFGTDPVSGEGRPAADDPRAGPENGPEIAISPGEIDPPFRRENLQPGRRLVARPILERHFLIPGPFFSARLEPALFHPGGDIFRRFGVFRRRRPAALELVGSQVADVLPGPGAVRLHLGEQDPLQDKQKTERRGGVYFHRRNPLPGTFIRQPIYRVVGTDVNTERKPPVDRGVSPLGGRSGRGEWSA
jgi:hypothetical protein